MTKRTLPAPDGLSPSARKLWRSIVDRYELRPDEIRILEDLCRHAAVVDRLEAEVVSAPLTVKGSKGQQVPNPLLGELRASRLLVSRLLGALDLPDAPERAAQKRASVAWMKRRAASARWHAEEA